MNKIKLIIVLCVSCISCENSVEDKLMKMYKAFEAEDLEAFWELSMKSRGSIRHKYSINVNEHIYNIKVDQDKNITGFDGIFSDTDPVISEFQFDSLKNDFLATKSVIVKKAIDTERRLDFYRIHSFSTGNDSIMEIMVQKQFILYYIPNYAGLGIGYKEWLGDNAIRFNQEWYGHHRLNKLTPLIWNAKKPYEFNEK